MSDSSKIKYGLFYILWIVFAWTLVNLYRFYFGATSATTNILINESIRFIVFMGPVVIFILCNLERPWYRWLGLYGCKKGSLYKTLAVAASYAAFCLVVNIYGFHKTAHFSSIPTAFWFTTFSLSIIMEEIAFRGFLFYLFETWNKHLIVLITSFAFAAKHIPGWIMFPATVSGAGFFGDFFIVCLVGCVLGYLYLATRSIWATWFVHAVNNVIVAMFN